MRLSGTEFRPNLAAAWSFFFFGGGSQGGNVKTDDNYAWAVRDGDVGAAPAAAAVPLPALAIVATAMLLVAAGVALRRT